MAFSGGVYTLPTPALVPGQTVSSSENNTVRNDMAASFNLTFLRNGTSTATANLPMGGYKLTGLGVATTLGDALSYNQAAVVSNLTNTALTITRVPYVSTGGLLIDSASFTFDGTTLTAGGFSTAGSVTLSGGTANGVTYLNGSKVLTSGSALTFDGANLGLGTTSPVAQLANTNTTGGISAVNPTGIAWNTTANDWGYVLQSRPASGNSYGLRVHTLGTTSSDYIFSLSSGVNSGSSRQTVLGDGTSIWAVGGSESMRLTSTGLGIGTSSPSQPFQLTKSQNASTWAYVTNGSNGAGAATGLLFGTDQGTSGAISQNSSGNSDVAVNALRIRNLLSAPITFEINSSTKATLDSSGNLGLGVTPSAWSGVKAFDIGPIGGLFADGATYNSQTGFASNAYRAASANWYYKTSAAAAYYAQSLGVHTWATAPSGTAGNAISFTQAMTLDSSGNLLVGTTSTVATEGGFVWNTAGQIYIGHATGSSSGNYYAGFRYGSNTIGYISQNGTNAVTYATSSDYRLKENIQPMTGALDVVQQLNPVTYTWKADGSDGQGFIAHELQAVVPDCVTGEKDAVDEEGKPVYQGIDTSFLVATLTKAIQELKAELDATKAEVAALKGN